VSLLDLCHPEDQAAVTKAFRKLRTIRSDGTRPNSQVQWRMRVNKRAFADDSSDSDTDPKSSASASSPACYTDGEGCSSSSGAAPSSTYLTVTSMLRPLGDQALVYSYLKHLDLQSAARVVG
jgi:hypothetical protein